MHRIGIAERFIARDSRIEASSWRFHLVPHCHGRADTDTLPSERRRKCVLEQIKELAWVILISSERTRSRVLFAKASVEITEEGTRRFNSLYRGCSMYCP